MKTYIKSWGAEIVIGDGDKVIRLYVRDASHGEKVTIDLSQVRDKTWDKYLKIIRKYPEGKIIVAGAKLPDILKFFDTPSVEVVGINHRVASVSPF